MPRTGLALLLFVSGAAAFAGCFETAQLIPDGSGGVGGGAGGSGASTGGSSTGGDATGGSAVGGSGGTGSASGGQGGAGGQGGTSGSGGNSCVPANCPGTDNDCRTRVCNPGCVYAYELEGTLCDDDGGSVCDGGGTCVECNVAGDCVGTDMVCVNKTCLQGALSNGDACTDGAQCTSTICQQDDGVCCDMACAGTCESCLAASTCGSDGACLPITAGTDPDAECGADNCFAGSCLNGTIAFVTSAAYNGNLSGLTGADALCAQHAMAACLPGTYLAWLSDATDSPSTRFTQQMVPYRMVDGTQIAVNYASLVDNNIDTPLNLDQTGAAPPASGELCSLTTLVHTGTNADGTAAEIANRCDDWTSSSAEGAWGNYTEMSNLWSRNCNGAGGGTCAVSAPLYCFQQ